MNVIVLVFAATLLVDIQAVLKHCSLRTSSVFPSKLKLNTDPEAEPYRIHIIDDQLKFKNHMSEKINKATSMFGLI